MLTLKVVAFFFPVVVQLGFLVTNSLRSKFIEINQEDANNSLTTYGIYETALYGFIIIFQLIEYCVLLVSVIKSGIQVENACRFLICSSQRRGGREVDSEQSPLLLDRARKKEELHNQITMSWGSYKVKRFIATLLLSFLATLAFALPALGFYRDFKNIPRTNNTTRQIALAAVHEAFKFSNLLTNFLIRLLFYGLCFEYMSAWDYQRANIPEKHQPTTILPNACDTDVENSTIISTIDAQVRTNTYSYYKHYLQSGELTAKTRRALSCWFMMQYMVYLIKIYTDVVHVVRPVFRGTDRSDVLDIYYFALYILYDLVCLFCPYLLGLWMTNAHSRYYQKMSENHLLVATILEEKSLNANKLKDEATQFYVAEVITKKIPLCTDFNFSPGILGITVPVTNPGYSVPILLAIFALIANSS